MPSRKLLCVSQEAVWDKVANEKKFRDAFYLAHLAPLVKPDEKIVEFGCGYGRILQYLHEAGYTNLQGYDFSSKMLQRGKNLYPHLALSPLTTPLTFPLEEASTDAVIISTVLCCIPEIGQQQKLMQEVSRILKPEGVIYLSDFLISSDKKVLQKYTLGYEEFSDYGVYRTSEDMVVRHHQSSYIRILMKRFKELWWYEEASETMNGTPIHGFHSLFQKEDPSDLARGFE